jgi:HD-like signal output (HDOD) protein
MLDKKKFQKPNANVVYEIDGVSYGLDDEVAAAIRASISRRLESKTLEIPRLPQVASRILELSNQPDTGLDEVVLAISSDPILASRMVSIANSAAYSGNGRIEGLQPALMRLGTKIVKETVFAESIRLKIFSSRSYRTILEQSWKLSLGTAIACSALSRATGLEPDGAFLMGLLHDTGKPVLITAVAEIERQNKGHSIGEAMVEILISQLHEEIGAYVLKSWGMSETIVEAAGMHHRYRVAGKTTAACTLIYAGNLMCQHLGIGDVQRDINFSTEHAFAELKLADNERVAPLLESVSRELESLLAGIGG